MSLEQAREAGEAWAQPEEQQRREENWEHDADLAQAAWDKKIGRLTDKLKAIQGEGADTELPD